MARTGRPSKFKSVDKSLVKLLVRKGFTDVELAQALGVTQQTINNWKKKHPKFFEAIKNWKNSADERVERSLYERALGFTDEDGKHYAPDTSACIFWLKNRNPDQWRDRREVDNTSSDGSMSPARAGIEVADKLSQIIIAQRQRAIASISDNAIEAQQHNEGEDS